MLGNLFSGRESSRLLLLKDYEASSAKRLVESFTSMALNRGCKIHFVTFEMPPEELRERHATSLDRLTIWDGYSDPLLWDGRGDHNAVVGYDLLGGGLGAASGEVVVVDCLTPALLASSDREVYRALHSLTDERFKQVVARVNADVHSEKSIGLLDHLAQMVVTMTGLSTCAVQHKKGRSGRVSKMNETFVISENLELSSREIAESEDEPASRNVDDVTRDLTFNLNLKESEKMAREQLVLPYTRSSGAKVEHQSGGRIFYSLDDDEDPDEDLEI